MARRGFIAEYNHQCKIEAQRQARTQREAERAHARALREAEQARKREERAAKAAQRASEADRKKLEKEAREAHVAAMEAKVVELNASLAATYDQIDGLLEATLDVDDYVDLETLRAVVAHPPFDRPDLEKPIHNPSPSVYSFRPNQPASKPPMRLRLIARRKYCKQVEEYERWVAHDELERAERERAERTRCASLQEERVRYEQECKARETEATEQNKKLDTLIANLGYGAPDAVEEYVSIVLSNSVFPEGFPVDHEFEFDVATAELRLRVLVPGPESVPNIKTYRYQKSADEIVSSNLPVTAVKDRYASALNQVALRSIHEIFEADRRGIIKTISLQVSTATANRATGNHEIFCLIAAGAERESFLSINLANVVPEATLAHLGAVVSKNPYDLVQVDSSGIRQS